MPNIIERIAIISGLHTAQENILLNISNYTLAIKYITILSIKEGIKIICFFLLTQTLIITFAHAKSPVSITEMGLLFVLKKDSTCLHLKDYISKQNGIGIDRRWRQPGFQCSVPVISVIIIIFANRSSLDVLSNFHYLAFCK